MDPLSITTAVSSIVFTLVKTGRQLRTIFECFQEAKHSLFMIQTECTVLAAALSQVQVLFSGRDSRRTIQVPKVVLDALESSIIGCTMVLSILTKELSKIVTDIEISHTLKRKQKSKYIWQQDKMSDFVQQLRRQSMALGLLLKAMDSTSTERILSILESGRKVFDSIEDDVATIRASQPSKAFPASIAELSVMDGESLYDLLKHVDDSHVITPIVPDDEVEKGPQNHESAPQSLATRKRRTLRDIFQKRDTTLKYPGTSSSYQ